MMQLTLYSTTLISSLIFIQMNYPLAMGLMLLIQTMQICLLTGLMANSFWFSYVLFLIFLGGVLVLFIYVTSLPSNEVFSLSMKTALLFMLIFILLMSTWWFMDKLADPHPLRWVKEKYKWKVFFVFFLFHHLIHVRPLFCDLF